MTEDKKPGGTMFFYYLWLLIKAAAISVIAMSSVAVVAYLAKIASTCNVL